MQTRKYINILMIILPIAYFMSYITRINYSAVLLEMVNAEGITKTAASMALTGSAITYGVGQLISGYLGDKIRPHLLIFTGLIISSLMNFLVPLFPNPYAMLVFWCINGFAQAMMWPPIVKIMSELLSEDDYKRASVKVSWGSSFGTIAVYLLSPVMITVFGWKSMFVLCALLALGFAIFWKLYFPKLASHFAQNHTTQKQDSEKGGTIPKSVFPILALIMLGIALQGILRDGITTWMPTYISETFNLGSSISILTGVALPIFSIFSFQIASILNRKYLKNELSCAAAIYFAAFVAAAILSIFSNKSVVLSVVASTVITGCMHGVNVILICMVPMYFKKFGKVSFMSGLLNSCTYIGSAISSTGMAVLAENFGWHITVISWAVIALIGTALCILGRKSWNKVKF